MSLMRRLVGGKQTSGGSESASVARIVKELESLDESTAYFLASFAYVLARVAAADLDVDPAEEEAMYRILLESTELDAEHARLVTQIAREQAAEEGGTENYLATREFREHSSREQQVRLLRALLQVAAADGHVSERKPTKSPRSRKRSASAPPRSRDCAPTYAAKRPRSTRPAKANRRRTALV